MFISVGVEPRARARNSSIFFNWRHILPDTDLFPW